MMTSPHLPPELEHYIFTLTAHLHRWTLGSLLLVSRRVHEWLESLRYTFVSLTPFSSPEKINYLYHQSPEFMKTRIKSILLVCGSSDKFDEGCHAFVRQTTTINDLTIDKGVIYYGDVKVYASSSHLRRLTLGVPAAQCFVNILRSHRNLVFPTLTHLECGHPGMPTNDAMAAHFPWLTHFMANYLGRMRKMIMNMLADPQNLVLLVLKFQNDKEPKSDLGIISTRASRETANLIYVSLVELDPDLENIWRKRAFENIDLWEVAESMLKARHYNLQRI
ncbi:hypothetical protein DL96DRAFT_1820056 [Flagelloscypha sp. PMI_526]|nr:hypothetical protein DL96DRAFT_1820056 [Flagelloscypha sp. PMI_526]